MSDREHTESTEPEEQDRKEPNGTTLTEEGWIEVLNKYERLSQYAKRRRDNE